MLKIATVTIGVPVGVVACAAIVPHLPSIIKTESKAVLVSFGILMLFALTVPLLAFMSGALLGNALRRVGFLGTPKELPQGEEEGDQEEAGWTIRQQVLWGFAGSIIGALISAVASVLAASINQ